MIYVVRFLEVMGALFAVNLLFAVFMGIRAHKHGPATGWGGE